MTPERYQRLQLLADIASSLAPDRRRAYLDEQCAGDEELRRDVERLLAVGERMDGFLENPAMKNFADTLASDRLEGDEQPMVLNGRYLIESELGRGGFGVVYQARDLKLQPRRVVAKILHPDISRNNSLKTRFFREMDALARFETPYIVAILDKGETPDGNPFFVMEYVEGSDLRRAMRNERMDFARVARLMRQIARAVSYAHDRLVFHRDLKPENIMLRFPGSGDESAVLLDFGIATVKEWQPPTRGAKTAIIGTPAYMAPEQINGAPSAASDIWALGVIAYEMLTGQQPFPVPRDKQTKKPLYTELSEMQRAGVQLKPMELCLDLPEAAQAAILRALTFDPQSRHAQARDFGEELAEALTGERPGVSSSPPPDIITPGIDDRDTTLSTIVRVNPDSAEVVISYAAQDLSRAIQIANRLRKAGVACWMADHACEATSGDRSETVRAIKQCKALLLLCSTAAMQSNAVKQDLQMAWSHERPYLPLLIERIDFAEQAEYLFEGGRWIEAAAEPHDLWLSQTLQSLSQSGIRFNGAELPPPPAGQATHSIPLIRLDRSLQSLRRIARLTDRIWPMPAAARSRSAHSAAIRGMGAPQEDAQHGYPLGSRVRLAIESDREGYLSLIDEGPEGIIYCLCPSHFAPDTRLQPGCSLLPQERARYDSFKVTGKPGREHLLAIVSDEPLGLNWMTNDPGIPARVLKQTDIETLLVKLRDLGGDKWVAFSTYFELIA
ncbi:MAG: protein kinase [Acidobacteria bacterium]|nr:protein kinase [Acidobacteriota bacterium]